MIELHSYFNRSWTSVDNMFQGDHWYYNIRINDYQLITIAWNLGLILVPWFFGWVIIMLYRRTGLATWWAKIFGLVLFLFWLLFIPNAIYVVSDVRHLANYCEVANKFSVCEQNVWMILFFYVYATIGWVSFVYIVNQLKNFIADVYGQLLAEVWCVLLMPFVSLGFLLGLVQRWNSWEAFMYPLNLKADIVSYTNDVHRFTNWLIFTIFLYILYWSGNVIFRPRNS
ncbi:MAG: DUF1361 domain-containing protein [Candidatus Falkowbacteria bacterium]